MSADVYVTVNFSMVIFSYDFFYCLADDPSLLL